MHHIALRARVPGFVLKFDQTIVAIAECKNSTAQHRNTLFNSLLRFLFSLRKSDIISITGSLWTS